MVKVLAGGDGELYVLGSFAQSVTWGTSKLMGGGPRSAYLVRLGPGGVVSWALPLGGDTSTVEPTGMARDTAGNLLVVGRFVGKPQTAPVAGADTLISHGKPGLFVLKVAADGAPLYLRSTAPPPDALGDVIEVASRGGQSFVMPRYGGALKFGFYSVGTLPGDLDFALFRLLDDATPNAAFNVREPDAQSMMRLGVSSAGTPMVLGRCTNYVTVDGKTLNPCKGLFLWHLSEGAGFSLFGATGQVTPWFLRNAPGEGAIFSASFDGEIQLGDSKVFANGDPDSLVVASLGSNDKVINKLVLHGPGPREARDLAYLNASARALTGIFKGKLTAQGLSLAGSAQLWQGFVVGFAANLAVTWQLGLTGEQLEVQPSSVAHIPGGALVVAGSVRGEGSLAGSPVSAPVERSFLVQVTPP